MLRLTRALTTAVTLSILLALDPAPALHAADNKPSLHTYYLDEPVFDGRAFVMEAGRDHAKTIVLVHGLGPNAAQIWEPYIATLAHAYHVIAVDLPGFGRSSKGNHLYSPANYARFLDFLIERTANTPYLLVGHSMGANVAINYSLNYPERFERLMLVDVAGILHRFAYSQYLTHFGIELIPEFYPQQSDDLRNLAKDMLESLSLDSKWMTQAEMAILNNPTMRQTVLQGESNTIAGYAMAMADYSGQLQHLPHPTLVLWGEADTVTPLRTAQVLARRIPQAALVTLSSAGHSPMSDQPQAFRAWLQRFADATQPQLNALLNEYAYRLPRARNPADANSYHCQGQRGVTVQGEYDEVRIDNCKDVSLKDIYARRIRIRDSEVRIENCQVQSTETALEVEGSVLNLTACHIEGRPAMALAAADVDVAGTLLRGDEYALRQRDDADTSAVLFSVSQVNSRFVEKAVHGPVKLQRGEGM